MLQDILKALGLDKQEMEIFMHLARLECVPASRIAQKTGLKRTSCYQILENMVKNNLIKRGLKYGIRYYTAATPQELVKLLEKKTEPLEEAKILLNKNLSEIEKFYRMGNSSTSIAFYEGFEEIKLVYDKILAQDDPQIYSILRKMDTTNHPLSSYWKQYLKERIKRKKKSFSLVPADQLSEKYIQANKKEHRNTIQIAPKEIPIFGDLKVSGKLVSLISQHEGRIFGVTIEDERIAKMFKGMLKVLWKHYSE